LKILACFFIQAVEEKKYGWFWECPNEGDNCPYFHKLPQDYIFKSDEVVVKDTRTLEEIIEERRSGISGGTPVNAKTFKEWKDKKLQLKAEKEEESKNQRTKDIKSGHVKLTGREIILQQFENNKIQQEEEGDDFDIVSLLKKKVELEEEVDKENAKKIKEIAKDLSDLKEPNEEQIQKYLYGDKIENDNTLLVKEVKVDIDLFNEDIEDFPDEDVDENGENGELENKEKNGKL